MLSAIFFLSPPNSCLPALGSSTTLGLNSLWLLLIPEVLLYPHSTILLLLDLLPHLSGTIALPAGDCSHCWRSLLQLLGTIVTSTRFCCHISWGPQSCLLGTIINLVKTTFTSAGNHCHICWVRPLVLCTLWDSKAVQHFEIKFIVSFPVGWNIYMVGSCGGAKTALPCIPKP